MAGGWNGAWNGLFILSALAGRTSYLYMKMSTLVGDNQQTSSMSTIMPIMSVWFTISVYHRHLVVYWVTSNLFQIVQQLIYNRMYPEAKQVRKVQKNENC